VKPTEIGPALLKRFPLPSYEADADKKARGKLLVIAGSRRLPGAALLVARAAYRSGCGGVRIATSASIATHLGFALPELMVVPLPETRDGSIAPIAAPTVERQYTSCDAAVIGPGIDETPETDTFARHIVETAPLPLVVDAQAILALASGRPIRAKAPRLYTPHLEEMAHLTGRTEKQIDRDRETTALEFAKVTRAVVTLKGRHTLIATPRGQLFVNTAGSRALGTAGSGDTLAGIAGSLLAQGLSPPAAAIWSVHLHALAGESIATHLGPDGPLASDFIEALPAMIRELRNHS
jgi:ADP-dependent NAD(P)H-hydrate dehydratase